MLFRIFTSYQLKIKKNSAKIARKKIRFSSENARKRRDYTPNYQRTGITREKWSNCCVYVKLVDVKVRRPDMGIKRIGIE